MTTKVASLLLFVFSLKDYLFQTNRAALNTNKTRCFLNKYFYIFIAKNKKAISSQKCILKFCQKFSF